MANAPQQQPVSSLSAGMAAQIQHNINGILGNPHDPNPGATLQHYVSRFQDDPSHYTPVLAMASATQSHLNTQKQLQQQPQQAPVAQQTFSNLAQPQQSASAPQPAAQQAPAQNSGIGQLPAANMEGMAEGGITGYSGATGSYVNPAQESMMSGISADQALQAGYLNPLSGYGTNESQGSIQGVPLKKGGAVKHFDAGGNVPDAGVRQPMGFNDPLRIAMANMGYTGPSADSKASADGQASGTQGIPMYQYPLNPAAEARQALGGNAPAPQATPALNNSQSAITPQVFASAQPQMQTQNVQTPPTGINKLPSNFTPGAVAQNGVVGLAKSLGFEPNMTLASAAAGWEKDHQNPINAQQLELGYQTSQIRDAMLANGVDPDQNKQFQALQARQEASDALLDKKQNLSIIAAGLGMIKSGNPWEAIAAGAGQGVKAYGDALDTYQQQQQHLADSRMSLEQSKQMLNAGMVDKAMGQVDQATKYQFDYNKNSADNVRSIFENNRTGLAGLAEHQMQMQTSLATAGIQAGAQKYSADQMFSARTGVAGIQAGERGTAAQNTQMTQQAKLMMNSMDPMVQAQGKMLLQRLSAPQLMSSLPNNATSVPLNFPSSNQ